MSSFIKCVRHVRGRPKLYLLGSSAVAFFLLINTLAYRHAWSMTHFVTGSGAVKPPQAMTLLEKVDALVCGIAVPRPNRAATPANLGFRYQAHCIPVDKGTCLSAWYMPHVRARGIVLLFHGYASCKADLLNESKAFQEMGYATLLVDFRGSAGSTGDTTSIGVFEADDVQAACNYVARKMSGLPMILYGHSMGGAAILRACAVHGIRPAALVLECPFDSLLTTVGHRFTSLGLPAFPGAHLLVFWGGLQHGFNGFTHNPADYARAVRCPTLLLRGAGDNCVTDEDIRGIARNLHSSCRLESLPGVGHESAVAVRPARWRRIVGDFLGTSATMLARTR